jgi:ribosome-associated toxin RatA of RatAB toxin-antitoxin module
MTDKTTSSIAIAAPRHDVMAVVADFGAYPQWATGVRAADVLTSDPDGRASRVRFQFDAGIIKDNYVLHYDWDGDAQVSWELDEAGAVISEMSGSYQLADEGHSTQVRYELAVGIRVPMIGMLKRRAEKMIIDAALKGLKSRAEATVGQP